MVALHTAAQRRRQSGVSLIELMVAMIIGLFLLLGAVTLYNQSRNTYRASEGVARLQEVARLALDVIEADVRMANFWGLNSRADYIGNAAGVGDPLPADFTAAQGARISSCGGANSNWAIDLGSYLDGTNNDYGLACGATYPVSTAAGLESDVLVVRRANEVQATNPMDLNRIHLQTSRIQGSLFIPACADPNLATCIPAGFLPPVSQSRELVVHAYYVATQSTLRNDVPSLRRKVVGNVNSDADFVRDEEIVAGVEHMQVRLGVDTNGDANVDVYKNPGAILDTDRVVSATIWLRVRAEDRDLGHVDGNSYQYADMGAAFAPGDNYRRIVVTRTIQLRNTRI
jgi:type IV pilus assembly protein PilW